MDMFLGLDMFKWYQCFIDLKKNVFVIGIIGFQIIFFFEGELLECVWLVYGVGREDVWLEEIVD